MLLSLALAGAVSACAQREAQDAFRITHDRLDLGAMHFAWGSTGWQPRDHATANPKASPAKTNAAHLTFFAFLDEGLRAVWELEFTIELVGSRLPRLRA